jgi:hypothetical protein
MHIMMAGWAISYNECKQERNEELTAGWDACLPIHPTIKWSKFDYSNNLKWQWPEE